MKNRDQFIFLKALMTSPRLIGAICPSSERLAKEMVSSVFQQDNGLVIELGAGTGVITGELFKAGLKSENVIIIEYSKIFVEKLRTKFPTVQIIEGNASHLTNLLKNEKRQISAIVSSLPLRSLPQSLARTILDEISQILSPGGKYIQLTYSFLKDGFYSLDSLEKIASKRIWRNLPPARVDVWMK